MSTRNEAIEKPQSIRFDAGEQRDRHPQEYYDEIKARFADERDLRLAYRPEGTAQYTSDLDGRAGPRTQVDPYGGEPSSRASRSRPRRGAVHRRRVLGPADVGAPARARRREHPHRRAGRRRRRHVVLEPLPGRRLRRRRPTTTCRCSTRWSYVPSRHYAEGPEIFAHCQAIARRYDLYELAVFQTTVTSTVWDDGRAAVASSRPTAATA